MFTDALTSDVGNDNPAFGGCSSPSIGGAYLSDISPKDRPWDNHKAAADGVADLYRRDAAFRRLAARVADCAGRLLFAWLVDPGSGETRLSLRGAQFCRARHCPICQWRRSLMWQARFFQALPAIQAAHPTARWLFLTLTVRNCPVADLRANLSAMNAAWGRLVKRSEFRPVLGWVRTSEITRGKDGSAHPHFHSLLMVPSSWFGGKHYVTQPRWRELWRDCARLDYDPIVDIRAIKGDVSGAVKETMKYAVKASDMEADAEWFFEMTRQLHKLRFIATGGVLKEIFKPESEISNDDMVNPSESESTDDGQSLSFGWVRNDKRYRSD